MSAFGSVLSMASGDDRPSVPEGWTGKGLRIAVVHAVWNWEIVERLLEGVERGFSSLGATIQQRVTVRGCYEIPLACRMLAQSGEIDAIVAAGAVIRGETTHYEIVSNAVATGIQQVQLETGIPIGFGVLTVESTEQGLARSEGVGGHNVGEEAAVVAVEMARLSSDWQ